MKLSLLGLLACPLCGGDMKFSVLEAYPRHDADVDEAMLACKLCAKEFPVLGGVPRMHPAGPGSAAEAAAPPGPGFGPGDKERFLERTLLPGAELAGKLVLDSGCGPGTNACIALSLDAEVVALDVPGRTAGVAALARSRPKIHPVEGDLLRPPFKKGAFDAAYAADGLHRAGEPREALRALASMVKPRGWLSAWVPGKAGPFADFCTNPLRADAGGFARNRRLAWLACLPLALSGLPRHTKEELTAWCGEEGFAIAGLRPHGLVPEPGVLARRKS